MAKGPAENRKYLSHTLAEWACGLEYDHISPRAIEPAKQFWYGWHHATLTPFAAPIAAGRVLRLTPDQMVQAIGIGAARTFCPGAVTAGKLTNMKNTVDPWATRMGVESALLAKRGFSGPEHIIDGKEGLYAVFSHVHPPTPHMQSPRGNAGAAGATPQPAAPGPAARF